MVPNWLGPLFFLLLMLAFVAYLAGPKGLVASVVAMVVTLPAYFLGIFVIAGLAFLVYGIFAGYK